MRYILALVAIVCLIATGITKLSVINGTRGGEVDSISSPQSDIKFCSLPYITCTDKNQIYGTITAYTCDTDCITASGLPPLEGRTVACPRSLKLRTAIDIQNIGRRYCEDRTARWVEKKYPNTYDIFVGYRMGEEAKNWGVQKGKITVL